MNKKAGELKPGMFVLKPGAVAQDWIELSDPALDFSPSGAQVSLRYADGSQSRPMPVDTLIELWIPIARTS
ncbi:hypothetical protein GCM10009839_33070 [Catenulispora yoronensis]|uniref:Uncharacterized protein n=1 Tax=Catenulispora yoronensis TaxID=450799 RepID=A0ABN2U7R7_9ACTN